MEHILQYFLLVPFLGFVVSIFLPEKKEKLISGIAFGTVFIQFLGLVLFIGFWIFNGSEDLNLKEITLLKTDHYEFFIDFYFDKNKSVKNISWNNQVIDDRVLV